MGAMLLRDVQVEHRAHGALLQGVSGVELVPALVSVFQIRVQLG